MLRWVLVVGAVVAAAAIAAGVWYSSQRAAPISDPVPEPFVPAPGAVWFEDVAGAAGVGFRHFDPATPIHLIAETLGSGVGWIDYDADGWPDLFCVQQCPLPPAAPGPAHTHRLYRNNRDGTFTDVTERVGLGPTGYGTGCAVGDYDNDGFDDLLVTHVGGMTLYHNEPDPAAPGRRRFRDATPGSGLADPHYATSAAWGDLDGDGLLDLYVCNYAEIDFVKPITCTDSRLKIAQSCNPSAYPMTSHRLFRNAGGGKFTDVTASSGVAAAPPAPGLAVAIIDLDGDGKPDIYVPNDMHPAYLFRNRGGMRFEDVALPSGVALSGGGSRIAGMCAEVADFDGTGRPSLFVTNFHSSPNVLFLNRGGLRFHDDSYPSGLGTPSLDRLGFGACALDADLDGFPDLAVANGHVQRKAQELFGASYAQEAQLFLNNGSAKFKDASATAGPDFRRPRVGRGLARADYDNDGLPDLAISGVGDPAGVLRNRTATANGWVSLELIGDGVTSNRNAVGAVVKAEWAGAARTHYVIGGGSYLSANDRRLLLGLGTATKLDKLTVRWPSGEVQEFKDLPAKSRWRLRQGKAEAEPGVEKGTGYFSAAEK